jgi:predicted flap endonuclease-1-like 5' DNA nuclease
MVALSLQTLLLMGAAYFIGAALACVLRRSLFAPSYQAAERRVDPLPEVVETNAKAARFGPGVRQASAPPAPQPVAKAAAPPPAPSGAQDLRRIRLIDAGIEARLNTLGVDRYDQIAAWTRDDVKRVGQALGLKGRINQENWIEQALILAKGGETHYSARRARGEAPKAAPTPDEGERPAPSSIPLPRPMSRAGVAAAVVSPPPLIDVGPASAVVVPLTSAPLVAERAAFANRTVRSPVQPAPEDAALDVVHAVPVRPVLPERDNLQRIGGVTPEIEQGLNAQDVSRYLQIAQWSPSDIERFEKQLLTGGRIARENWVEQAQILSRGGDTRFSRAFDHPGTDVGDAPREQPAARTDLGSLRSVRSRAYQGAPEPGPEAAQRAAAQNKVVRASNSNDLKRIRGIGVLIERKLNSMGVITYDHIANWTADDIDRVSQSLDFKGRIERENWVEQARILSAGGQTEFSRRVDRGEVETSRAKT